MNFYRTTVLALGFSLVGTNLVLAAQPTPTMYLAAAAKPSAAQNTKSVTTRQESAKSEAARPGTTANAAAGAQTTEREDEAGVKPLTVVVWGDSIAAGAEGLQWPAIAERMCNVVLNTGRPVRVINAAIGGMTAAAAREQFAVQVGAHAPDVVIIQFGLNDLRFDGSRGKLPLSTPAEFGTHLTEMVKKCRDEARARVVLFGNHRTRVNLVLPSGRAYDEARADYGSVARQVAQKNKVEYHDLAQELQLEGAAWTDFLSVDGVHLSPLGYNAYGRFAANVIAKTVR